MPEKGGWSHGTGEKRVERKETGRVVKKDIRQEPKRGGTHGGNKRKG